jgi:hypothetical protein
MSARSGQNAPNGRAAVERPERAEAGPNGLPEGPRNRRGKPRGSEDRLARDGYPNAKISDIAAECLRSRWPRSGNY